MRRTILVWLVGLFLVSSVQAHHSFLAEFDAKKPITLTGAVTKIEWANPHIYIYLDAKNETGKVINWAIEMGNPNSVIRLGWTRNALKVGDAITIEGSLARDGSNLVNARTVLLAGKKLFTGSSEGNRP